MNLTEIEISRFSDTWGSTQPRTVSVLAELQDIRSGTYKAKILAARALYAAGEMERYRVLKRSLPAVTWSGTFGSRLDSSLMRHSQLLIIDVDHLQSDETIRWADILRKDKHIISVWLSPSGAGLKFLVNSAATPAYHKAHYHGYVNYLRLTYGLEVDTSGSNVGRLCYVSYDPALEVNANAEAFAPSLDAYQDVEATEARLTIVRPAISSRTDRYLLEGTEGRNKARDHATIRRIIKYLRFSGKSITSSYSDWVKVGLAIANTFTLKAVGEKYFLQICAQDGARHDEAASRSMLIYLYLHRRQNAVSLGSIIHMAKLVGWDDKYGKIIHVTV